MDNFQIIKLIGKGTFGRVYKSLNKTDNKNYAIKKISVLKQSFIDNMFIHIFHFNCGRKIFVILKF